MTKLKLKTIKNVNIRKDKPSSGGGLKGIIYKDQIFELDVDIIEDDSCEELEPGNRIWYRDRNGDYLYSGGFQTIPEIIPKILEVTPEIDWNLLVDIAPENWRATKGQNVKIAVIDSGINSRHQDFHHLITSFTEHYINNCQSLNGAEDIDGHGTQCAGLIGSVPAANESISGIANESELFIFKARHEDYGPRPEYLMESLKMIIEKNIDIVSISMEFPGYNKYSKEFDDLFFRMRQQGIIIFVAAGDNSELLQGALSFPALRQECITVGGMDKNFYSSNQNNRYPAHLDFIVPSIPVYTTNIPYRNSYCVVQGSSYSTALLAGVCALFFSYCRKQNMPLPDQQSVRMQLNNLSIPFSSLFSGKNNRILLSNDFKRL